MVKGYTATHLYLYILVKTCIVTQPAFTLGETIAQLTDMSIDELPDPDGQVTIFTDKTGVVKAARLLLSSVTKVLVLADRIVIKQIITSRNKVLKFILNGFNQFAKERCVFCRFINDIRLYFL